MPSRRASSGPPSTEPTSSGELRPSNTLKKLAPGSERRGRGVGDAPRPHRRRASESGLGQGLEFGHRLLNKVLATQTGAEVDVAFAPDGLRVSVRMPLPSSVDEHAPVIALGSSWHLEVRDEGGALVTRLDLIVASGLRANAASELRRLVAPRLPSLGLSRFRWRVDDEVPSGAKATSTSAPVWVASTLLRRRWPKPSRVGCAAACRPSAALGLGRARRPPRRASHPRGLRPPPSQ
jgi:hypothetical protein